MMVGFLTHHTYYTPILHHALSAGNKRFRDAVSSNLERYNKATTRFDKSLVVHDILETIQGVGGRFMKYDAQAKTWKEMSRQQAKEKVGHAIRDAVNSFNARREKKKTGSASGVTAEVMQSIQRVKTVDYAKRPRPDADYSARKRRKISEPPPVAVTSNVPIKSSPIQPPGSMVARLPSSINQSPIEQQQHQGAEESGFSSQQEATYVQQLQQASMMSAGTGEKQPAMSAFPFEEASIETSQHATLQHPPHASLHDQPHALHGTHSTMDPSQHAALHLPAGVQHPFASIDPVAVAQHMEEQRQRDLYFSSQQQQHPQDPPAPHAQGIVDEDDPFSRAISMVLGPVAPHHHSSGGEQ